MQYFINFSAAAVVLLASSQLVNAAPVNTPSFLLQDGSSVTMSALTEVVNIPVYRRAVSTPAFLSPDAQPTTTMLAMTEVVNIPVNRRSIQTPAFLSPDAQTTTMSAMTQVANFEKRSEVSTPAFLSLDAQPTTMSAMTNVINFEKRSEISTPAFLLPDAQPTTMSAMTEVSNFEKRSEVSTPAFLSPDAQTTTMSAMTEVANFEKRSEVTTPSFLLPDAPQTTMSAMEDVVNFQKRRFIGGSHLPEGYHIVTVGPTKEFTAVPMNHPKTHAIPPSIISIPPLSTIIESASKISHDAITRPVTIVYTLTTVTEEQPTSTAAPSPSVTDSTLENMPIGHLGGEPVALPLPLPLPMPLPMPLPVPEEASAKTPAKRSIEVTENVIKDDSEMNSKSMGGILYPGSSEYHCDEPRNCHWIAPQPPLQYVKPKVADLKALPKPKNHSVLASEGKPQVPVASDTVGGELKRHIKPSQIVKDIIRTEEEIVREVEVAKKIFKQEAEATKKDFEHEFEVTKKLVEDEVKAQFHHNSTAPINGTYHSPAAPKKAPHHPFAAPKKAPHHNQAVPKKAPHHTSTAPEKATTTHRHVKVSQTSVQPHPTATCIPATHGRPWGPGRDRDYIRKHHSEHHLPLCKEVTKMTSSPEPRIFANSPDEPRQGNWDRWSGV